MAESILIWELSESSMGGGSWTDEIRCTRRKDGTFSLQQRRNGGDGTRSFAGTTRIKSPHVFVQVITEMGNLFGYEIDTRVGDFHGMPRRPRDCWLYSEAT
jgi:hypothetical protein